MKNLWQTRSVLVLAVALGGAACETMGPEDRSQLMIAFRAPSSASSAPAVMGGAGGTLALTGVFLLVDEFKLEGNEAACEAPGSAPDCAKFEAEPHLLELALVAGETGTVIEESAPPGTFTRLKFETKARDNANVQAQILAAGITDWPADASLMVTGVFTPDGATEGESFRVFFDGEVKIVLALPDPLVISNDVDDAQIIAIDVDPYVWFLNGDLRGLDFAATGEVHKLEVKLEDGFTKIELERR